jgi:hypothetical protein
MPHIDFLPLDLVARLQIDTGSTRSSCCGVGCVFENSLDHFVPNSHRLRKPWSEVLLDLFESITVGLKGTEGDAIRPSLQDLSWVICRKACVDLWYVGEKSGVRGNADRTLLLSRKKQERIVFALDSIDRFS